MKDIGFEEALKKLEDIVSGLESGDVKLEEAIKKYEEGLKLSALCTKKLDEIQNRIDVLTKKSDGGYEIDNFEKAEEVVSEETPEHSDEPVKKARKKSSKREQGGLPF